MWFVCVVSPLRSQLHWTSTESHPVTPVQRPSRQSPVSAPVRDVLPVNPTRRPGSSVTGSRDRRRGPTPTRPCPEPGPGAVTDPPSKGGLPNEKELTATGHQVWQDPMVVRNMR